MRWQGRQGSGNVDDRRGGGGAGLGSGAKVGGGLGIVGVIIVIIVMVMGGDPSEVINMQNQLPTQVQTQTQTQTNSQPNDEMGQFASVVLKETEDVWNKIFSEELGKNYPEPTLVLFSQYTTQETFVREILSKQAVCKKLPILFYTLRHICCIKRSHFIQKTYCRFNQRVSQGSSCSLP